MKVPAGTLGRGPLRARGQAGLRAIPAGPPCRLGERIARPPPPNEPGLQVGVSSVDYSMRRVP